MSKFEAIQVGGNAHLNRVVVREDTEILVKLTGYKNLFPLQPIY
jgi:hypothetical protein